MATCTADQSTSTTAMSPFREATYCTPRDGECVQTGGLALVDSSFNQTALSLLEDLVSFRRMYESLNAKALGNHEGVPAGHRKVQVRSVAPSSGFLSRRHDDDICLAVIGRICHAANRRLGMHYKKLGDYHRAPGSRDEFERTSESSR
ncbi:uncharacterized protein LOC115331720 [Ixodes scapularis]|uniref:uncharacterized protein LOC115331720 n=1 Tax=Ixodes scapularis TaxID=6945 RepID=UPI001A9DE4AF|nr:uncharacterized protein LOC115331720 [Ixodes scapularis]